MIFSLLKFLGEYVFLILLFLFYGKVPWSWWCGLPLSNLNFFWRLGIWIYIFHFFLLFFYDVLVSFQVFLINQIVEKPCLIRIFKHVLPHMDWNEHIYVFLQYVLWEGINDLIVFHNLMLQSYQVLFKQIFSEL